MDASLDNATFLPNSWILYFHDPNDTNWTIDSYVRVASFLTVEEYWATQKLIAEKMSGGMFFLMREGVLPIWEDASNTKGGCFTLKVDKHKVADVWETFSARMICESLLKGGDESQNMELVNGISVSPKKAFCILKVWLRTSEETDPNAFAFEHRDASEASFKRHVSE